MPNPSMLYGLCVQVDVFKPPASNRSSIREPSPGFVCLQNRNPVSSVRAASPVAVCHRCSRPPSVYEGEPSVLPQVV